jgi:hypothetical protein
MTSDARVRGGSPLLAFAAHELWRSRRLWAVIWALVLAPNALRLSGVDVRSLPFPIAFLLLLSGPGFVFFLPVFSLVFGGFTVPPGSLDGTDHLVFALPLRGRTLVSASWLASGVPILLLAWIQWLIGRAEVRGQVIQSSRDVLDYLWVTYLIAIPSDVPASSQGVLLLADLFTVVAQALTVFFFLSLGGCLSALSRVLGQGIGRDEKSAFPWVWIPFLFLYVWFPAFFWLGEGSLRFGGTSCAGWWFGIQQCVILTPLIVGMVVLSALFVWFTVWAWERRIEVR